MKSGDEASAPEGFDLGRLLFDLANKRKPDEPIMQMIEQRKLHALFAAYERALEDNKVCIPSALHAAIEGLRR